MCSCLFCKTLQARLGLGHFWSPCCRSLGRIRLAGLTCLGCGPDAAAYRGCEAQFRQSDHTTSSKSAPVRTNTCMSRREHRVLNHATSMVPRGIRCKSTEASRWGHRCLSTVCRPGSCGGLKFDWPSLRLNCGRSTDVEAYLN